MGDIADMILDGTLSEDGEYMGDIPRDIFGKQDNRPKKDGWAPGNYTNKCFGCDEQFTGDKRARTCADCAYKSS